MTSRRNRHNSSTERATNLNGVAKKAGLLAMIASVVLFGMTVPGAANDELCDLSVQGDQVEGTQLLNDNTGSAQSDDVSTNCGTSPCDYPYIRDC